MNTDTLIGFEEIHQLLKKADIETLKNVSDFLELAGAEEPGKLYNDIIDALGAIYDERKADSCFEINECIKNIIEPPKRDNEAIIKELSDEISIIGTTEGVKDVTIEGIMNLELPPSVTLRETSKEE